MSTRSGNPAKKAAAKKTAPAKTAPAKKKTGPTSAAEWKSASGIEDIEVPSGNIAKVRRVGPEAFMGSGIVPDALSPMIDEAIKDKKGLPPAKVAESISEDPESLPAMIEMLNRVVVYAVIQPKVEMTPGCMQAIEARVRKEPVMSVCGKPGFDPVHKLGSPGTHKFREDERDPELLYVDEVSIEDRVFIMNFAVGGTRDLERFRGEHAESMAGMAALSDVLE